jgi:PncC family amidohydrolase
LDVSTQREIVSVAADGLRALKRRGSTLAVAESCTGGLIGHLLTEIPGSSEVFLGGAITYSNDLKVRLGVDSTVLETAGAVSVQVAEMMAASVRKQTGADIGLAVTGIAGPGGGSETKPVGLTYVAVADAKGVASEAHIWCADRSTNKLLSAGAALRLLLARIGDSER